MDENLVGNLDAAILCVIAFVLFFAGLVYHLRREDKREGYPLEMEGPDGRIHRAEGFPAVPSPKIFNRPHGRGTVQVPRVEEPENVRPADQLPPIGFPMLPGADPLMEGVGAAAWTRLREEKPDLDVEGDPKLIPLNDYQEYYIPSGDPDPRGWDLYSADERKVGKVHDLWFNRAEFFLRYYEVSIDGAEGRRLVPAFFAEALPEDRIVRATTLAESDLRRVPVRAADDCITMREEDRLNGFFAGGLRFSGRQGQIHDPA
ncbi:photosynthetic reaction center subunit H [Aurantiacibacter zhengii]|nr:photosynthetic reaction center subunit H [Aurantiacibacter zhengii]